MPELAGKARCRGYCQLGDQQQAQSICPTNSRLGLCAYTHLMFKRLQPCHTSCAAATGLAAENVDLPRLQECLPPQASGESRSQVKKT